MRRDFLIAILLASLTLSLPLLADELGKKDFVIPKAPPSDLIKEISVLKLQDEPSVQKVNPPSDLFITALAGTMTSRALTVESHGRVTNYDLNRVMPVATIQFNHYLFDYKWGKIGWAANAGYSYSEYSGGQQTSLHLVPVSANAVFRGEWKSNQKVMPYLMAGPTYMTYFQRGTDQYNTSQSSWLANAVLGIAVNLNRLHWVDSRNDTELVLQYQRNISQVAGGNDLNGDSIQLGGSLAL